MAGSVRFWFRGEVVVLDSMRATTSVLEWLRDSGESRGTKEGCNQGDCGACTVVVGDLVDGDVRLATANSCLLLLPMLHGRALFTVEDVGTPDAMHAVQRAMVEHGGSQCGFCTPGFVMSMWSFTESARREGASPTRAEAADALTGNLCRCTGYRPILDAAASALRHADEGGAIDWEHLVADLTELGSGVSAEATDGSGFARPTTEDELAAALAGEPDARIVAGGTDLVVALRATGEVLRDDLTFVSVTGIPSMHRMETREDVMEFGAAVSVEDAWAALTERLPALDRMWARFASPGIRRTATIGGNIANASPIADLVPVLMALDADVIIGSGAGQRTVPLSEFATDVRRNVLQPGEFLARIAIPQAAFDRDLRAHKVSRRFDDDISTVSGVFAARIDTGRLVDVRVVFGGLATTVRRAAAVEVALLDQPWTHATLEGAREALSADFAPIDDHRASAWYRAETARALLERWWLETGTDAPAIDHDVWAVR